MKWHSLAIAIFVAAADCPSSDGQDIPTDRKKQLAETPSVTVSTDKALSISIDKLPKPPEWWSRSIDASDDHAYVDIIRKEGGQWRHVKEWNAWLSGDLKPVEPDKSRRAELHGKAIDISILFKHVDSKFFSARVACARSERWSIGGICLDNPSGAVLIVLDERNMESFTHRIDTFVPETVGGRHTQLLEIGISGDKAVVYIANYLGVSVDVVDLGRKKGVFRCSMRYEEVK